MEAVFASCEKTLAEKSVIHSNGVCVLWTGCVSRGKCPVSFPANTGFAATFDRITIKAMAGVIGRELRSLYNARRAYGLDCWGPVINLVRSMRAYLAHRSARRLIG